MPHGVDVDDIDFGIALDKKDSDDQNLTKI